MGGLHGHQDHQIWLVVKPHLWKIWSVNWDDDIPNWMGKFKKWQPNHQPVLSIVYWGMLVNKAKPLQHITAFICCTSCQNHGVTCVNPGLQAILGWLWLDWSRMCAKHQRSARRLPTYLGYMVASLENPSKNEWFRGNPISGNLHISMYCYLNHPCFLQKNMLLQIFS